MFYRGRLGVGDVKVMVVGQEGAQDESLAHRSFAGGTGARMQHFLNHLGITESYLFLNTFCYPIFGQYGNHLRWLAQDPGSPIAAHRNELFEKALDRLRHPGAGWELLQQEAYRYSWVALAPDYDRLLKDAAV